MTDEARELAGPAMQKWFRKPFNRIAPEQLRHDWRKVKAHWECSTCGMWTGNLPLYKKEICRAKDRRKRTQDRRK